MPKGALTAYTEMQIALFELAHTVIDYGDAIDDEAGLDELSQKLHAMLDLAQKALAKCDNLIHTQ